MLYNTNPEYVLYCEALELNVNGEIKYLLHRENRLKEFIHEVAEFPDRSSLIKAFPGTPFVGFDKWKVTDHSLGYNLTEEDFAEARKNR